MNSAVALTPAINRVAVSLPRSDLNGCAAALRAHVADWAVRSGLHDPELAQWGAARFELLLSRMYPAADLPLLRVTAEAVLWLFLVDSYLDPGAPGDDVAYSANFARETAVIAAQGPSAELGSAALVPAGPEPWLTPPADPLLRCPWELIRSSALPGSGWWRKRLFTHLAAFAASMHDEVKDRAAHRTPTVGAYITGRRVTSGWDILADFGEAGVTGRAMAMAFAYRRLRRAGGDLAFGMNDVLSLPKELAAGEYHNLVVIAQREHESSMDEALAWTDRWLGSRLDEYLSARAELLASGFLPAIGSQVRAMDAIVTGILDWSLETGRY